MLGVIKKLIIRDLADPWQNFGFIAPEGVGKDLFFHARRINWGADR